MSDTCKLVATEKEKAEVLNNFFAPVFPNNSSPHSPQTFVLVEGDRSSNIPPTVSEDQVQPEQPEHPQVYDPWNVQPGEEKTVR